MTEAKFSIGDQVRVLPDRLNSNVRPGIYTIVRALPPTGQGRQYRAKNAMDQHERVLEEGQLEAV
jgi:hypothetical protein